MTFTVIEKLPRSRVNNHLHEFLEDFMNTGAKFARVDAAKMDYKSPSSMRSSIGGSVARFRYPIKVTLINGELYLIRTDK